MSEVEYFVPTKASKRNSVHCHEVIEAPTKRPKRVKERNQVSKAKIDDIPKTVKNILKIKRTSKADKMKDMFEIFKFTKTGMSGAEKLQADKDLIVKLGGIPVKKKYKNYRELKEEIQVQKKRDKLAREQAKLGGIELLEQLVRNKRPQKYDAKQRRIENKKGAVSGMISQFGKVDKKQLGDLKSGKKGGKGDKSGGKKSKKR